MTENIPFIEPFTEALVKLATLMYISKNEQNEPKFKISEFQKAEVITGKVKRIFHESKVPSVDSAVIYHDIKGEKPLPIYQNKRFGIAFIPYKGLVSITNLENEISEIGISAISEDESMRTISTKRAYDKFINFEIEQSTQITTPVLSYNELNKNDQIHQELLNLISQLDNSYRESFFSICREFINAYTEINLFDGTENEIATKIKQDISNKEFENGNLKLRVNGIPGSKRNDVVHVSYLDSNHKKLLTMVVTSNRAMGSASIILDTGNKDIITKNIPWNAKGKLAMPTSENSYYFTNNYKTDVSEILKKDRDIAKLYSQATNMMIRNGHFVSSSAIMENCYSAPHHSSHLFKLMMSEDEIYIDTFAFAFNYINSKSTNEDKVKYFKSVLNLSDTYKVDKIEIAKLIYATGFDIEKFLDGSWQNQDMWIRNHEIYVAISSFKLADVLTDSLDDIKYDEHSSNIEISHSLSL